MSYMGFVPVGTVLTFAGTIAPEGWLLCDGAAKSRTTYASLFLTIQTNYGVGNGSTTFNLPDMRGVFARGAGTNGTSNYGGASGHTPAGGSVANKGAQKTAKNNLNANAAPSSLSGTISDSGTLSHNHGIFYPTLSGAQTQPNAGIGNTGWCAVNAVLGSTVTDGSTSLAHGHGHSGVSANAQSITVTGDTETTPAFLALNYIIKF